MWSLSFSAIGRFHLSPGGTAPRELLRICCHPQGGGDSGSLPLSAASPKPFHLWLIGLAYRPSDGVGLHRYDSRPLSSGGGMHHPRGPSVSTVFGPMRRPSDSIPGASPKGGGWHTTQAEMPSPEVTLPGSFVAAHSPDLPAERPWLRTPARKSAEFEQSVPDEYGPARVGFSDLLFPPFIASPFVTR